LPFERIDRKVVVRTEHSTNPDVGYIPAERPVEMLIKYGVVNINKPAGPTSHQVSDYVQKILHITKAGHSGTLDPKVTGCLPVALGRGTRVVQALLPAGKEYVCLMHLHKDVAEKQLREVVKGFVGKIKQLPPLKSSVKRQLRTREIYYIDILEIKGKDVLFMVGCQAGTYIRKLVHDIGEKLGSGAHMDKLRRTRAGPFDETTLVTLQELTDAYHYYVQDKNKQFIRKCILPLETALDHLPKVWVMDSAVNSICHGANLKVPGICKLHNGIQPGDLVAVLTLKGEVVGIGDTVMMSKHMLKKEKGLAVKVDKVFMEADAYPAYVKK